MKYSEFHRIIRRNGWICVRARGSHYIYRKGDKCYPVAYHGSDEVPIGTLRTAIKIMDLNF